ncbi:hypothetical protein [Luteimonas saliphila]|uniref:hypothetical protein n=1 Tax=Luteimonas saliphila TaxID=2804919 RepID=UPI00192D4484|nr:hypothetical protein [Luteimonas saliphila]
MPRFGNENPAIADTDLPGTTGRAWFTRFTLSEAGTLNHVAIYSTSTGGGLVKGLVYADNAGSPGALVAVGAEVAVINGDFAISTCNGEALSPGNYWLGATTADHLSNLRTDDEGGTGWSQWAGPDEDAYDNPPNPWSGGGSSGYNIVIYADYSTGAPAETLSGTASLGFTTTGALSVSGVVPLAGTASLSFAVAGALAQNTFGNTFPGIGGVWSGNEGRIMASKFVLSEPAEVTQYFQHFGYGADDSGSDPGGIDWIGIIFEDVAGEPGDVIAVSSVATTTGAGRWQSAPMSVTLAPGTYWLGTQASSFTLTINSTTPAEGGTSGNLRRAEGSSLAIAPSDPWPGTASSANGDLSAYAVYIEPANEDELTGSAGLSFTTAGALTTRLLLSGGASLSIDATGALATSAELSGAASLDFAAAGALRTRVTMAGSASLGIAATGALRARARLAGQTGLAFAATGRVVDKVRLAGAAGLAFGAAGDLRSAGALSGTASLTIAVTASLRQRALLRGTASLTFGALVNNRDAEPGVLIAPRPHVPLGEVGRPQDPVGLAPRPRNTLLIAAREA